MNVNMFFLTLNYLLLKEMVWWSMHDKQPKTAAGGKGSLVLSSQCGLKTYCVPYCMLICHCIQQGVLATGGFLW